MQGATTQALSVPSQNLQPETAQGAALQNRPFKSDTVQACSHSAYRPYIERGPAHIHPEDYLPVIKTLSPSLYGPLSKVVEDCELWPIFRQKAAQDFCKGDENCFLEYSPLSPFCFAESMGSSRYQGGSKLRERLQISYFSLNDLAEIAEQLILERDSRQTSVFQHDLEE